MYLILVAGQTGQGKSHWVNQYLQNQSSLQNGRVIIRPTANSLRQYVFDINNEYAFPDDSAIRPVMRHTASNEDVFFNTARGLKNYNIVFEDATGFLRGIQSKSLIRMIQAKRHTGNNWILLFHSLARIPPELMEFSNYLILHKTGDNERKLLSKFDNEQLIEAFNKVQAMPPTKYPNITRMVLHKFRDY